jgi:hypothetical protein
MAVDQQVPSLTAGDNLSRKEFLRLWEMHPEIKRAELIGGVVYMPSPLSTPHADKEGDAGTWLGYYKAHTPGCGSGHNATTFLLDDTPQPDVDADGIWRSRVFPGLWLDGAAFIAGDMKKVLAVLQLGMASTEHAEFVRRLATEKARRASRRKRRKSDD